MLDGIKLPYDNRISITPLFVHDRKILNVAQTTRFGVGGSRRCEKGMFGRQKLTTSIADLDTSLTNVHRDDFTHFQRELKLRSQKMRISVGGNERRVEEGSQTEWGERILR